MSKLKFIISGGGTGGHIFPAISIANKLKEVHPDSEILFVGAEGRMEMEKVPAAGYKIIGLPIEGLKRKLSFSNIIVFFKLIKSLILSRRIIRKFKPNVAIGVGGYASAPLLWSANSLGIPTIIQEQNGFAGLTNKILGEKATKICVAYDGMEKFFPKDKIVMTGNPIRSEIKADNPELVAQAIECYGLNSKKNHIFIVGGSLGSKTLNNSIKKWITDGCPNGENIELIWQCGKTYKAEIDNFMKEHKTKGIKHFDFIKRMDLAYAAADLVISRSGASSISELCVAKKATIFVPSPNVTDDHQTHNAMALVNKGAGMIISDAKAEEELMNCACTLIKDKEKRTLLEKNIGELAKFNAADMIVEQINKILMY